MTHEAAAPRTWQVRVEPAGIVFEAAGSEALMAAARRAGRRLPSLCRNGTCRACIAQLTQGQVRHLVDWPGLLPEERAGGAALPCVAAACSDVVLWLPGFTGSEDQRV